MRGSLHARSWLVALGAAAAAFRRRSALAAAPAGSGARRLASPLPHAPAPAPPRAHTRRDFGGPEGGGGDPFLAVGTGGLFGEDYPALGRVLLFQVRAGAPARPRVYAHSLTL